MHEEATITTTAASSKIASNNIINNPHQSSITIDSSSIATTTTTTIAIVHHLHNHPNATVIENYASTLPSSSSSASNANLTSQIVSPQTKIIISNSSLDDVVTDGDVSSVILNGAIANPNDPNVLIVGTSSTCDNDKNEITLNLENVDQQQQHHMEIEIVEGAAGIIAEDGSGDGSEAGEGKFEFF